VLGEVVAGVDHGVGGLDGVSVGPQDLRGALLRSGPEGSRPSADVLAEEDVPLDVGEVLDQAEQVVPDATPGVRICGSGTPATLVSALSRS
jgi:hypothetical protein